MFCSPFGKPLRAADDWREWKAILAEAGVRDARGHDARHTAATLLLGQGVDVRTVQQILGHSQTQRYTHVTQALNEDAAKRMNKALFG